MRAGMSIAVGWVLLPGAPRCLAPPFCPVELHPYRRPAPHHCRSWAPLLLDHIYPRGSCLGVISCQTYQCGCRGSHIPPLHSTLLHSTASTAVVSVWSQSALLLYVCLDYHTLQRFLSYSSYALLIFLCLLFLV